MRFAVLFLFLVSPVFADDNAKILAAIERMEARLAAIEAKQAHGEAFATRMAGYVPLRVATPAPAAVVTTRETTVAVPVQQTQQVQYVTVQPRRGILSRLFGGSGGGYCCGGGNVDPTPDATTVWRTTTGQRVTVTQCSGPNCPK